MTSKRFLLFASQAYSVAILRPLQNTMKQMGHTVHWYLMGEQQTWLTSDETVLLSGKEVSEFKPDAVFSASNWVPLIFPGIKVQVFHGFNVEKRDANKGHFRIRGMFDLYCTQGPSTTQPFLRLAQEHGYFKVAQTGWSKMDPLFLADANAQAISFSKPERPVIMFASTFTESLTAAPHLLSTLKDLIAQNTYNWILTLHPKTAISTVEQYRALISDNAIFLESDRTIDMLRSADIMICDTSSIVSEFLLQNKPVITFRTRKPSAYLHNITETGQLSSAIRDVLAKPPTLMSAIEDHNNQTHPYKDGKSCERIIDAVINFDQLPPTLTSKRPLNFVRKLTHAYKIYFKNNNR